MAEKAFKFLFKDLLGEVGNIGTGSAAYSLSHLLGRKILINIPDVSIMPVDKLKSQLFPDNPLRGALYFEVTGDMDGSIQILYDDTAILSLLKAIDGEKQRTLSQLTVHEISCLEEVSNILACSYLKGISKLTGSRLIPSIPSFAYDYAMPLIQFALIKQGLSFSQSIVISTLFSDDGPLNGEILFFPGLQMKKMLFSKFNIAVHHG